MNNSDITDNLRKHWDLRAQTSLSRGVGINPENEQSRLAGKALHSTVSTLLRHFPLSELKSAHVLDFGGGAGRIAKALAPHVEKITLAEISGQFLESAKRNLSRFSNVEFVLVDAIPDLPFSDGEINLTISYAALDFSPNVEIFSSVIAELDRVSDAFAMELGAVPRNPTSSHIAFEVSHNPEKELGFVPDDDLLASLFVNWEDRYLIERLLVEPPNRPVDRFIYKLPVNYTSLNKLFGQHLNNLDGPSVPAVRQGLRGKARGIFKSLYP